MTVTASDKSDFEKLTDVRKVLALLVEVRKSRNISQREMGDLMGLGQPAVSSLENSPNPSISMIIRYANALGLDLSMSVHLADCTVTQSLRSYY